MKTILFVDHDTQTSGSTVSLLYLVKHFYSHGFKINLLTAKEPDLYNLFSEFSATCIPAKIGLINPLHLNLTVSNQITFFSNQWFRQNLSMIRSFVLGLWMAYSTIKKVKPDIIYVNEYVSLQASLIARLLKIPCVTHVRSPIINGRFGIRRYLLRHSIINFNNLCFAITNFERTQLPQYKKNVFVAHEFIDDRNFRVNSDKNQICEKFGLPADKHIVVMLGGIASIKGTYDFLKSAEMVIKNNHNIFFVLAGSTSKPHTEYIDRCITLLNSPALIKNMKYLGDIPNAVDLISCSNILVSSNSETHFSRPVIEAWALTKPVIVTNVEHSVELVSNQKNGIIVKLHDHQEMADAILRLVYDSELAHRLAEGGFKKVKDEFDQKSTLCYIYDKCMNLISH